MNLPERILIPVTPSESKFVQNLLFDLGYVWDSDTRPLLQHTDWPALQIKINNEGKKVIRGFSILESTKLNGLLNKEPLENYTDHTILLPSELMVKLNLELL